MTTAHLATYEMGFVLFMDIVGYSKEPIDRQRALIESLKQLVSQCAEYKSAASCNELLPLPTGDGMALVFRGDPFRPVKCALEMAEALKAHPQIKLRMGVHAGLIAQVSDIRDQPNAAGSAINVAQRVMDCAAAGQIVLSKDAADLIAQDSNWRDRVCYLCERVVKHGLRLQLYSLETYPIANPVSHLAADQTLSIGGTLAPEILSHTMSNPRYKDDLLRLDRNYQLPAVIGRETVIIVVGTTVVAELLEALRDRIDAKGGEYPFRRGIVLSDKTWFDNQILLGSKAVVAIGGPPANKLTSEFAQSITATGEGKYAIAPGVHGFFRKGGTGLPQIGLWGDSADKTRQAVEAYINLPKGLSELLAICWGHT
jgi:hypothetical protein